MSTTKLDKPRIIVICGQTGSGKTSLAITLCKKFNGEIVNADSRQVYREMDIGTAKGLDKNDKLQISNDKQIPNSKFQTIHEIPVYLINIVEPNERYNVGQFKKDAASAIENILLRSKIPFIVGGTGLYIDALVENFQLPEEIPNNKFQITKKSEIPNNKNIDELVKLLEKIDPQALKIVDLKNKRRVERALEYCMTTGKKFSDSRKRGERKYEVLKIAPMVSREKLIKKIDQRVEEMIHEGLEDEVKKLAKKYGWESEAMTGIGYKEWKSLFVKSQIPNPNDQTNPKSQISKEEKTEFSSVVEEIKKDTRQYAKRQMTWFKRDKEIHWIEKEKEVEKLVKEFIS